MPDVVGEVLKWFGGGVAVIVTLTGVAYWLFQTFATGWLSNRFARQLEDHKHQLSTMLDRATRLHAQEFEVLPLVWERLTAAVSATRKAIAPLRLSSDLTWQTEEQLEDVIRKLPWPDSAKAELRHADASARNTVFNKCDRAHDYRMAWAAHGEFNEYLVSKSIFIEAGLRDDLRRVAALIWKALDDYYWADEEDKPTQIRGKAFRCVTEEIEPLRDTIMEVIHARLRADAKVSPSEGSRAPSAP
ncbi:MAG: hypothetical protein A2623_11335 [Caulobacterales bacterium RIFCSPHIGHO2_01_FULL_70_19]|nr:MAG: hypothetical protein A2623_11335 [Caulobacterales bacterium RIFCSPHIGHO2_01_FULL_70_19]